MVVDGPPSEAARVGRAAGAGCAVLLCEGMSECRGLENTDGLVPGCEGTVIEDCEEDTTAEGLGGIFSDRVALEVDGTREGRRKTPPVVDSFVDVDAREG
jgi:hypothetical protein